MEIQTAYAIKLFFSNPAFFQIYFEAIANALDADASEVQILISTDGQINPKHLEITISDNGQGFTDQRFDRFRQLKEPDDPYHKGLGRLVYLQYFSSVGVVSIFENKERLFSFSNMFKGESKLVDLTGENKSGTVLKFNGFTGDRLKSYDDLKPSVLKDKILEHFLPYFHSKKKARLDFKVSIQLVTQESKAPKDFFPDIQTITPNDIPDFESKVINDAGIDAFGTITMSYMLKEGMGEKLQITAVCIDGRTLPLKLLPPSSIPFNHSVVFLFESDLFNGKSDSSRQRLVLPETISEATLYKALRREMANILNSKIPTIEQRNTERLIPYYCG